MGAFVLALVPHIEQLPFWVTGAVIAALVIRCFLEYRRLPLPSNIFCSILALCLLAGVILTYQTMFGREAGTAFTVGLIAIKFYEMRGPRDIALIIFSSFFVVMSSLLYSQALELFIYSLIMMWVLTALLIRMQVGDLPEDQLLRMLQRAGVIFLQALPLTVFLFFFFPRFPGTLQITFNNDSALGITDRIEPGSIARLSKDDTIAMYAKFNSDASLPTVETMYWRGLTLWNYQHGAWTVGEAHEVLQQPAAASGAQSISQDITINPHNQRWLFALDSPTSKPSNTLMSPNWATIFRGDVLELANVHGQIDHRERYHVLSSTELAPQVIRPDERTDGIRLPGDDPNDTEAIDPDVRALAERLPGDNQHEQVYVSSVIHYFRSEHFVYSASPGAEDKKHDWLPRFLFKTKTGFCEHYASAFAVLMRLKKIPTRLVVGYQGAQYNPYDNNYIVRQSDAHAWDEIWIESKKSWVREDPTAMLAAGEQPGPGSGAAQKNEPGEDLSIQFAHHRFTLLSSAYVPDWMHRSMIELQLRRQQIEANWDDWVFSYDPDAQDRLAQALGFGRDFRVQLGLACLLATGICVVLFRRWIRRKPPVSPVETFYAAFCRTMAQRGIPRANWEGPLAYTERVAESFPDKKEAIHDAGWIVARARYGPAPADSSTPKELTALLFLITSAQAASSSRES